MNNNWSYTIVGYVITAVTLVSYFVWIKQRSRQLRRNLPDENRD